MYGGGESDRGCGERATMMCARATMMCCEERGACVALAMVMCRSSSSHVPFSLLVYPALARSSIYPSIVNLITADQSRRQDLQFASSRELDTFLQTSLLVHFLSNSVHVYIKSKRVTMIFTDRAREHTIAHLRFDDLLPDLITFVQPLNQTG